MGGQPTKLQRNFGRTHCNICSIYEADTAEHILFNCESLDECRDMLWDNVMSKCTDTLKNKILETKK